MILLFVPAQSRLPRLKDVAFGQLDAKHASWNHSLHLQMVSQQNVAKSLNVKSVEKEVTSLLFKRRVREQKNETAAIGWPDAKTYSRDFLLDVISNYLRLGVAFLTVGVLKATQLHVKIMKKWRKLRGKVRTVLSSATESHTVPK